MINNEEGNFAHCVPFTIYRKSFLEKNNLTFMKGVFHEDTEFTPKAYYMCQRLFQLHIPLYFVRQTPNSITRSTNYNKNLNLLEIVDSLEDFSLRISKKDAYVVISNCIASALNSSFVGVDRMPYKTKLVYFERLKRNTSRINHFLKSKKAKYVLEYILLRINMKYSILLYSRLHRN